MRLLATRLHFPIFDQTSTSWSAFSSTSSPSMVDNQSIFCVRALRRTAQSLRRGTSCSAMSDLISESVPFFERALGELPLQWWTRSNPLLPSVVDFIDAVVYNSLLSCRSEDADGHPRRNMQEMFCSTIPLNLTIHRRSVNLAKETGTG